MFVVGPCFLLLPPSCLRHRRRPPTVYCQQNKNKEEENRCERHARSFCVWTKKHTIGTTRMTARNTTTITHTIVASRAINNPRKRCLSAGTADVSSARHPAGGGTATIARSVSTPVTSMTGSHGTG